MSGGLFHTLNVGAEALFTTRQGVDTAGHNIASAQVEGYSRQRINIKGRDPSPSHGILIGNGVYVGNISRAHDAFLDRQATLIQQELGRSTARAETLGNIEQIFSPELNGSVSDEVTKFFGSLENLANFPADYTVRTSVVEAGKDLATAFRRVDSELKNSRAAINDHITKLCGEISDDLKQIAEMNTKIRVLEVGEGQEANDLRDTRERLLKKVSSQIEVHYYEDQNGMLCLRGPNEVTLVDGGHSSVVDVVRDKDNNGLNAVTISDWEGHVTRDVTQKIKGGALDALVELRDRDVPELLDRNNEMALAFAEQFNAVHRQGFGIGEFAEHNGRNFFAISTNPANAAAEIDLDDMIMQSSTAIAAASTPMAPGDNVNMNLLLKLKDAKVFADEGVNFGEYYANYTGALGLDVKRAEHIREATDIMAQDLNKRRDAVAGVSLDEEATSMMKWQANFTASSKVITTVDEMLDTVLSLKR